MSGSQPHDTAGVFSATDYNTFRAQTVANSVITRAVHLGCMTQLKINGVPMIGGKYVCVIPSPVLMDMRKDTTWTNTAQFNPDQLLWKWALFELDGAVFVEAMRPDLLLVEECLAGGQRGLWRSCAGCGKYGKRIGRGRYLLDAIPWRGCLWYSEDGG